MVLGHRSAVGIVRMFRSLSIAIVPSDCGRRSVRSYSRIALVDLVRGAGWLWPALALLVGAVLCQATMRVKRCALRRRNSKMPAAESRRS